MREVNVKYITVDCPYLNEKVDITGYFSVIRTLGSTGEKLTSISCDYSEECTCVSDCPGEKL